MSVDPAIQLIERDCGAGFDGARCGVVLVPLDYTAPNSPQIEVGFVLYPSLYPGVSRNEAVNIVGGGPGAPISDLLRETPLWPLRLALPTQTYIAIDPRGIGLSTRLECPTFAQVTPTDVPLETAIATCAAELGDDRIHYSTANTVRDFEQVRRALGIGQYNMVAFSYGTNPTSMYASLYPDAVRTLLLDGAYPIAREATLQSEYHTAMKRQFQQFCERSGACNGDDALEALAWVSAELRRSPRPIAVPADASEGLYPPNPVLDATTLANLATQLPLPPVFLDGTNTAVLTDSPATGDVFALPIIGGVLAARDTGDWTILEQYVLNNYDKTDEGMVSSPKIDDQTRKNLALNYAIDCPEGTMPWQETADQAERERQFEQAKRSLHSDAFYPFSIEEWLNRKHTLNIYRQCIGWPGPPKDRATEQRAVFTQWKPDLPVLVMNGDLDMNTPNEAAHAAAAQFPLAQFARFKHHGHAIIPASTCAADLM
ncbi:alpha/beta hydrolase, partial [Candidatus Gracilibacteria bacterium]|nr:alpha/beta hydrolase [Candidatus Gracilibacteria bacterium]